MGRKSKLKQAARAKRKDWEKDLNIIKVDADDNNWLYKNGRLFDPAAVTIYEGSLDACIDCVYRDMPTLPIEAKGKMRASCGEYGWLDGGDWHIIYRSVAERDISSLQQQDMVKLEAALAELEWN